MNCEMTIIYKGGFFYIPKGVLGRHMKILNLKLKSAMALSENAEITISVVQIFEDHWIEFSFLPLNTLHNH